MSHSDISFDDYSPKSILITGEGTKACKEQLKQIGCRWNLPLKGWICSKSKQAVVEKFIETGSLIREKEVEIQQVYLIKGNTTTIKDDLKKLGCVWIPRTGWMATESNIEQVRQLLETPEEQFGVGDILYTKVQYAGCSYHYKFGVVTKIMWTGKYRVHYLNQINSDWSPGAKDNSGVSPVSLNSVKPDISDTGVPNKRGDSVLVNKDGSHKLGDFSKYDPSMNLSDYADLCD